MTEDTQLQPNDRQDDDLYESELEQLNDDDFTKYLHGELSGTDARNKYHMEDSEQSETPTEEETKEETNTPQQDSPKEQETTQQESQPEVNYKEAYEQIFTPFKANGKNIAPRNVQEVIQLMQQGANYTKKMQTIAPLRKTYETLRKADIDENELNLLIDVHNGNKDAIKSILKRNKIDSMDLSSDPLNPDNDKEYIPNNNIASDYDVQVSEILSNIGDNISKVNSIVSKWDNKSKEKIQQDPTLLERINEEIQLGRYEQIQDIVDHERMLGNFKDVSDIELYSAIVTELTNTYRQQQMQQMQAMQQPQQQQMMQPVQQVPDKSKAAPSRSKNKQSKRQMTPEDLFNLSDEEFMKINLDSMEIK